MSSKGPEQGPLQEWIDFQGVNGIMKAVEGGNSLLQKFGDKPVKAKDSDPKAGRLDVWVDTITPLDEQCAQLGIELQGIRTAITLWNPKLEVPSGSYQVEVSDGSDTVGKSWEKATERMGKDQRPATVFEGLGIVKKVPKIFDSRRLAFSASAHDTAEILQIGKNKDGQIVVSPLFVGDTNTDHKTEPPEFNGEGKVIKEGKVATNLPFALVFATK